MAKVVMILGEPCVGKSHLVRKLLQTGTWKFHTPKWVSHHESERDQLIILGRYDEPFQQFPGTDRLSMAVQPHALTFVRKVTGLGTNVLIEGDRLSNTKFIDSLRRYGVEVELHFLTMSHDLLSKRRAKERTQNASFIERCKTKIKNIALHAADKKIPYKVWNVDTEDGRIAMYWGICDSLGLK